MTERSSPPEFAVCQGETGRGTQGRHRNALAERSDPLATAERVHRSEMTYASSCLRDKTLAAIELFAAQWRISFADAQVLLLDTGVRLPGKRRAA